MLFLIALVGAAIVTLVLWKAMSAVHTGGPTTPQGSAPRTRPRRVYGPDDDPDFLHQLSEKLRRRDEPPGA